jgi:hypothetical protein
MTRDKFRVLVPLDGENMWFTLCVCDNAYALAEVVKGLCAAGADKPKEVRVERFPVVTEE